MAVKKRFIIIVFMVLMNCFFISASLGITPALIERDFEPGGEFLINFQVVGAASDQKLKVYAYGDFAEYVTFDKTELTGRESFTAYVNLPISAEKPGKNRLYIRVVEDVGESAGLGTRLEIGALIAIIVPYPGLYAEVQQFIVSDANEDEPVTFTLDLNNLGSDDFTADVDVIVNSNNEKVDGFSLESKTMKTKSSQRFEKTIEKGYKSGAYEAVARVNYGKTIEIKDEFRIGNLFVNISNWSSTFIKGKINEFNIEVESKWNNNLDNVYAEVDVAKDGLKADSFKTPSSELRKWEKVLLKGYFNAEGIDTGTYDANIRVYYSGEVTEKRVQIKVVSGERVNTIMVLLVGSVVFLLIGIIVLIWLLRRKNVKK